MAARQGGVDENSQAFHDEVRANFQKLSAGTSPVRTTPKEPLRPSPRINEFLDEAPALPSAHGRSAMAARVSAPPSRESGSNGYSRTDGPTRVTLTPAMKEAARFSGISEREYAEQLIRLREEKLNNGRYGGEP
jgi:hypothetical protein